ncbi:MAG: cytochrome c nitrite reductase small subunit [Bacteroidales bacterium]
MKRNNKSSRNKLLIWISILVGGIVGIGIFSFIESNAVSYLGNKSETCINCHVMNSEFASWQHSSHREVTVCNDCHVPHNNFVSKYYFKASDGLRHATMFTLRKEPQVIGIKNAGKRVVKQNCLRCHDNFLTERSMEAVVNSDYFEKRTDRDCWDCHKCLPHGKVKGLSSTPSALVVDNKTDRLPEWLKQNMQKQ